jgi:hypothetical protein
MPRSRSPRASPPPLQRSRKAQGERSSILRTAISYSRTPPWTLASPTKRIPSGVCLSYTRGHPRAPLAAEERVERARECMLGRGSAIHERRRTAIGCGRQRNPIRSAVPMRLRGTEPPRLQRVRISSDGRSGPFRCVEPGPSLLRELSAPYNPLQGRAEDPFVRPIRAEGTRDS